MIDEKVIVHDPWYGPNITYSFEDFKKIWSGDTLYFLHGYSNKFENRIIAENKLEHPQIAKLKTK